MQRQRVGFAVAESWQRGRCEYRFGFDSTRQQLNQYGQQDPRGSFAFTGAATGSDFADFLYGLPSTAALAIGNADKYLRAWQSNAYAMSDWRLASGLTVNAGVRWEYASPMTERQGRLALLEVGPGFAQAAALGAADPLGRLSGRRYPKSLLAPYRSLLEPRVSLAWVPLAGSSLVIRAGYGLYADTGVYEAMAAQMAQQPPYSRSFAARRTPAEPLTLAGALAQRRDSALGTYAVAADFRPGYAQNWQASLEREVRWGLLVKLGYLGIQGTHARQSIYPNSSPAGAASPCAACPAGFEYVQSGGNSTRQAGTLQVRRRLQRGLSASAQVTWAKALDNAGLGGGGQAALVAQNWQELRAERGRSSFDQRVSWNGVFEYTTAVAPGWRGRLFSEWRLTSEFSAATGLPLTPVYPVPAGGTGFVGNLRPDRTGAALYDAPAGLALNPAAYAAPAAGQWGNAGRNSITGPNQLSWNATLGRTLRLRDELSADVRMSGTNVLNRVNYTRWDTTLGSALFGRPSAASPMRAIQLEMTVRF